jgi:PAS domain S-box-containing protein
MNTLHPLPPVPARQSLRWRLPFLISGLVALVLAMFLWAAYRSVEATLVRTAGERAQGAADQVARLLDGQRATEQLRQLSIDPDLRHFLETRTDEARETARARLSPLANTSRRIEVWDDAGSLLLEVLVPSAGATGSVANPKALPPGSPPEVVGIGVVQGSGETVFTDTVAEILGEGSAPGGLGYVRVRATFVETPPGIFSRLVGRDAVVRIGNRSGGVWTDFSRVLPAAPVDLGRRGVVQYRTENGEMRLGAVSTVNATPWAAWVEFPLATIIAPARLFLSSMIVVALIFVAAAAVLATTLAARITTPLSEMSTAAEAFAAGDYSRRVGVARRDEIGQLGRAFNAMAADVKTAADSLRKSEDSYRRLFASNPHPMWVYDVETLRFLDVNDMATLHYGYSRAEFLAMTIKDIRPPAELPALIETVALAAPPMQLSGVWTHRKKDGALIDVEVSSHELALDGRRARAVLAHDVTERLSSQQALRESEMLFRGMAETMPHIVWTARPDGRFEYYNHRWFDYTGLSVGDSQRAAWKSVLHPEDRQNTIERWMHAVRTGGSHEVAYRVKRASDGAFRWHIGRAAPLTNESGEIVMWVGTSTDVNDERRDQEALRALNAELEHRVETRTAELQASNEELESFSYSVSHDLRAPLRHVQGYVEMLAAVTDGQLPENGQRYLKTITAATVEMGELIDDLLGFSRIARIQMSEGRVSLDDLVRASISGLEMSTRDRNIVWHIAPLPAVIGDPSMLKQVFTNLLGNAVKYSRQRDPAEIMIGRAGEDDGRCVLFVRDNGAGFDMRYAHKLFGVFQRLHRADEFEGTGIGLATVRRIITRHGGRTWAEGKLDEGATIYFTLTPATADD